MGIAIIPRGLVARNTLKPVTSPSRVTFRVPQSIRNMNCGTVRGLAQLIIAAPVVVGNCRRIDRPAYIEARHTLHRGIENWLPDSDIMRARRERSDQPDI